jgi:hypothetical protein
MSTPGECGSESLPLHNFVTSDCGTYVGTAKGTLPIGSQLSINDSSDLSGCIVGPNGAYVQKITYEPHTGPARNAQVYVYGRGPEGFGSGSLDLAFFTANGKHTLSLSSSTPQCHTDIFDDGAPITSITWSSD